MLIPLDFFFLILHICSAGSFPKPLTPSQEFTLLQKMRDGDNEARNELIEHNLRLVAHIVKKYYTCPNDQDDLLSIGTIGLIKAVDSFKSERKTRLATYAARCIDNEILMYFRTQKKVANDISINEEIDTDKDGNTLSLLDILSEEDNILETVYNKICIDQLSTALEELDEREKKIIYLRYGLITPPLTQMQTAEKLGISRSYVSRIEKKALQKLKNAIKHK